VCVCVERKCSDDGKEKVTGCNTQKILRCSFGWRGGGNTHARTNIHINIYTGIYCM